MNLKTLLLKYLRWCPMTPDAGGNKISLKRSTDLRNNTVSSSSNLYQICPFCKKLVPENDLMCPYCNTHLSSEYKECPFCKYQISGRDTVCPHCGELLIYEYPKQVTAKRNAVLMPLGLLLLFSMILYWYLIWQKIISPNNFFSTSFVVIWLIGFVLFGAYIGKGDKDFWWGK